MNRIEGGFQRAINVPLAGLLALSMGAAACGDNTSETTPPPTTPITIETTIPPTTIPPATLPPTTTTEALPEDNNTCIILNNEVPIIDASTLPENITQPTAKIIQGSKIVDLGLFNYLLYPYLPNETSINGRLISCSQNNYINEEGYEISDLYVNIVADRYTDGSPLIVTLLFENMNSDFTTVGRTINEAADISIESGVSKTHVPISELIVDFEKRLSPNSQVGFVLDTRTLEGDEEIEQFYQDNLAYFASLGYSLDDKPSGQKTVEEICRYSTNKFITESAARKELIDLLNRGNIKPSEWAQDIIIIPKWVFFFRP